VYTARYPMKTTGAITPVRSLTEGAYEDDQTVVDCKKSVSILAERTVYNKAGETISHFKRGDPESLDFTGATSIPQGSVLSAAQRLICNEQLRVPLVSKQDDEKSNLTYLSNTPNGDGIILYGPPKKISDPNYDVEVLAVFRHHEDHDFGALVENQSVLGAPEKFRTVAQSSVVNCKTKKTVVTKSEVFNSEGVLEYVNAQPSQPVDVIELSPFGLLVGIACVPPGSKVEGTYEGINNATYKQGGQGEQKISIAVKRLAEKDIMVTFQTPGGGEGRGFGTLTANRVDSISLQSTAASCPGSYQASFSFVEDSVSWSFKGEDCGGPMEGHGTAKKTKG
jgi:hypothetical protein